MPAEAGPWDGAAAGPDSCLTPSFSKVILHEGVGVKHQAPLLNMVLKKDNLHIATLCACGQGCTPEIRMLTGTISKEHNTHGL